MERGLISLAALGAARRFDEISRVVRQAGLAGATTAAIRETLIFLVPYCGWPTALNALMAAAGEAPELLSTTATDANPLDTTDRSHRRTLGLETARTVNRQFDRVADKIAAIDPALVDHLLESAYGYLYHRPGLNLRERELLAVAMLAMQRQERQLRYHLLGAQNAGATHEDIESVMSALDDIDPNVSAWARDVWNMMTARIDS